MKIPIVHESQFGLFNDLSVKKELPEVVMTVLFPIVANCLIGFHKPFYQFGGFYYRYRSLVLICDSEYNVQRFPVLFLGQCPIIEFPFGPLPEIQPFDLLRQALIVDHESEGCKLLVADESRVHLADPVIITVPAYLEDCFGLVVEFGPDMAADVVIALVQMKDRMNMEIVLTGPFH